jgi:DNA replication protein DnaC
MASTWPELLAPSRHTEFEPERFMKQLLMAETAERQVRSIAYQMTAARFPAHRNLKGFDFAQAHVDEALVRELSALKAVLAHERRDHDQSQLRRVGERVRRCKADDSAAGPGDASLPHRRNRQ